MIASDLQCGVSYTAEADGSFRVTVRFSDWKEATEHMDKAQASSFFRDAHIEQITPGASYEAPVSLQVLERYGFWDEEVQRMEPVNGTYIDEIDGKGYRQFRDSRKFVHRWLWEKYNGRKLLPREVVHHENENKLDNRRKNLTAMSQDEHDWIHFGRNGFKQW